MKEENFLVPIIKNKIFILFSFVNYINNILYNNIFFIKLFFLLLISLKKYLYLLILKTKIKVKNILNFITILKFYIIFFTSL